MTAPAPMRLLLNSLKNKNLLPGILIVLAGLLAYANSFSAAFVFDDKNHILTNPRIQHLWPLTKILSHTNRPVVDLTLALNYAVGQSNPLGYHVFNLLIHLTSALVLFALLCRTFQNVRTPERIRTHGHGLALAATLLWTVHPLLTQSVTYIIQRAESLMGLFYLLTVYAISRTAATNGKIIWQMAAVVFCAIGMGCKEVMATAPVIVLLYDRIFLATSFRSLFKKRGLVYLGFLLCWVLLFFIATTKRSNPVVAGLQIEGLTPWNYGLTQLGVITHYLRLVFWPQPLCFDYFTWPLARAITAVLPQGLFIATLLTATLLSLRRHAFWGFWGIWFFAILSVTSSVFPIGDLVFEHRMYLPSIAPIVLAICSGKYLLEYFVKENKARQLVGHTLLITLVVLLAGLTIRRNQVYQNEFTLWQDVLNQWPQNDRAHMSVGNNYFQQGDLERAKTAYETAIKSNPSYDKPYYALATVYFQKNDLAGTRDNLRQALAINPNLVEANYLMGLTYLKDQQPQEARTFFARCVAAVPTFSQAHYQLGLLDFSDGKLSDAAEHFAVTVHEDPRNVAARYNFATALANMGRLKEALVQFEETVTLDASFQDARERVKIIQQILQNQ